MTVSNTRWRSTPRCRRRTRSSSSAATASRIEEPDLRISITGRVDAGRRQARHEPGLRPRPDATSRSRRSTRRRRSWALGEAVDRGPEHEGRGARRCRSTRCRSAPTAASACRSTAAAAGRARLRRTGPARAGLRRGLAARRGRAEGGRPRRRRRGGRRCEGPATGSIDACGVRGGVRRHSHGAGSVGVAARPATAHDRLDHDDDDADGTGDGSRPPDDDHGARGTFRGP